MAVNPLTTSSAASASAVPVAGRRLMSRTLAQASDETAVDEGTCRYANDSSGIFSCGGASGRHT